MIEKNVYLPYIINRKEVRKYKDIRYCEYTKEHELGASKVPLLLFSVLYNDEEHTKYAEEIAKLGWTHILHLHPLYRCDVYSLRYMFKVFINQVKKKQKSKVVPHYYVIEFGKQNGAIHLHAIIQSQLSNITLKQLWLTLNVGDDDLERESSPAYQHQDIAEIAYIRGIENVEQAIKYVSKSDLLYRSAEEQQSNVRWDDLVVMSFNHRNIAGKWRDL